MMTSDASVLIQIRCQPCKDDSVTRSTFVKKAPDSVVARMSLNQRWYEDRNEKAPLEWLCSLFLSLRQSLPVFEREIQAPDNVHRLVLLTLVNDRKFHQLKCPDSDMGLKSQTPHDIVVR